MNSLDEARSIENNTTAETEKKKRAHNVAQKEAGRALARLKKKSRPLVSRYTAQQTVLESNIQPKRASKKPVLWKICPDSAK